MMIFELGFEIAQIRKEGLKHFSNFREIIDILSIITFAAYAILRLCNTDNTGVPNLNDEIEQKISTTDTICAINLACVCVIAIFIKLTFYMKNYESLGLLIELLT